MGSDAENSDSPGAEIYPANCERKAEEAESSSEDAVTAGDVRKKRHIDQANAKAEAVKAGIAEDSDGIEIDSNAPVTLGVDEPRSGRPQGRRAVTP